MKKYVLVCLGFLFIAVLSSDCVQESPVVVWLARHGNEVPPQMAKDVSLGRISVGMPEDAVYAVIQTLGCPIIEDRNMEPGMKRLVYRIIQFDSVGKKHVGRGVVLIQDSKVITVEIVPETR